MAVDILGYLESQGVDIKYSGTNVGSNDVAMQCPWCDDPSYHLTIHRSNGQLNCWRCDFEGYKARHPKRWRPNFKALIREIEQTPWSIAKERWEEIGGESYSPLKKSELVERATVCKLPEESRRFSDPGPHAIYRDIAYKYIQRRGFSRYHIDKYDFHFCPDGFYRGRIIIPVYSGGKIVNWVGRAFLRTAGLRYRNCLLKNCTKRLNELLYGEENWSGDVLRIVEGVFDKIRIGESAVCLFRSNISTVQKSKLREMAKSAKYTSVILDPEAYSNGYEIAEEISLLTPRIKVIRLPKGHDPATLSWPEIERYEAESGFVTF